MTAVNAAEPVIVVHGLWVHGLVMGWLARQIGQCGFAARTYSYPSMQLRLEENAARLARHCVELQSPRVHIVGHSMGGLIVLKMLEQHPRVHCGRLVLIAPPYRDSFAARRVAQFPGGAALLGRSMTDWLAQPRPGLHAGETGVIAGTRGIGLGCMVAPKLPRPHDGVVALTETEIPGVRHRVVLHVSHSEMLLSHEVARQCCTFLRRGQFAPVAAP